MLRYNSYRTYLKNRFGGPVLKIPVNGGFSCPNRDGTKSVDGCSFCDNRSFSPVALCEENVAKQVTDVITRGGKRFSLFIPYLQPFSNTYGSVETLRRVYEPLLKIPGVCGLAVGTRPDCFSDEIYAYLEEISKRTYLCVELGLQSGDNEVLATCNRGHSVEEFSAAVEKLAELEIDTVAHCMIGLPGETEEKMIATAKLCSQLPLQGVKIHQLMIVRGTPLECLHKAGNVSALSLPEYAQYLCRFLSILRPQKHIHRLMADSTIENGLIAPLWSAQKAQSLQFIAKYMDEHNVVQGSACSET
ncbi:MAG TPA: TIGR01212 family radical SAM protein [Chitinispirillaceae bacterium]|nr:TIGR01212 family radical SAM protein [Chitinispirillaceae bacterium]